MFVPVFEKSTKRGKKYMVRTPLGRLIHFGDAYMEQYKDTTGLGLYSHLDHLDEKRRANYRKRHKGLSENYNNPEYAAYYSMHYLW